MRDILRSAFPFVPEKKTQRPQGGYIVGDDFSIHPRRKRPVSRSETEERYARAEKRIDERIERRQRQEAGLPVTVFDRMLNALHIRK